VHEGDELCLLPGFEDAGITVPLELYRLGPREQHRNRFAPCVMPPREPAPARAQELVLTMSVGDASLSTA
jgi:hypothetical protein